TPVTDDHGEISHFVSVWKDVTEKVQQEQKIKKLYLQLAEEKYKIEQILSFDQSIGRIHNFNKLMDFVVQKTCEILESRRCSIMFADEIDGTMCISAAKGISPAVIKSKRFDIDRCISGKVYKQGKPLLVKNIETDIRLKRKNGEHYTTRSFISAPIQVDGKTLAVINVSNKISSEYKPCYYTELDFKYLQSIIFHTASAIENARISKELNYFNIIDSKTKTYNYRYFTNTLDQEIKRLKRFSGGFCLMLIDIDHFRVFNDIHASSKVDSLLKQLAAVLNCSLREVDILCRYIDDEFAVILPQTEIEGAKVVAEKLQNAVSEQAQTFGNLTLTIGSAKYAQGMSRQEIVNKTEAAMHFAKELGSNQIYLLD
ncbi:MAG: GGDEF domain-containing protein, partial [Candidatus Omnitrophica bacterium]|nr:GGDEF domain-containing protein [Candidatus Omnitrophota bacterium]